MMKLFLKLLRDMKQSLGQFIAFVLIIAVGSFFYTGLVTLSDNLSGYSKHYFKEHHLSDLNVHYDEISPHDVANLSKIEGINKIEGRHSFDAAQAFEGYKTSLKIHSIPEENEINTPANIEGSIPTNKDHILLDSHYAKEHQYQVGDEINLRMNDKNLTFTISGLAENVEYAKKNDIQDHFAFGFAYIAEEAISEIADSFYYNEIMIDAKEGYDFDLLGQTIEQQSQSLSYVGQLSKERSFNYSQMTQTIYNNKLMSKVIPFVLFIIEAIILFLTMNRIIDSERNQVGIMKALGVKNRSIMLHYMGYPVLSGVLGSILGYVIAAIVFIPLVTTSIARSYSLPEITFSLSLFSIIPPILFSSAFGILACYLNGRNILKERAAQAMRPKPPKKTKTLWLERIPGVWNHIPYNYKLI